MAITEKEEIKNTLIIGLAKLVQLFEKLRVDYQEYLNPFYKGQLQEISQYFKIYPSETGGYTAVTLEDQLRKLGTISDEYKNRFIESIVQILFGEKQSLKSFIQELEKAVGGFRKSVDKLRVLARFIEER
jgi:hypothetical protein